jgi:N-acetylglucosamine malate deacetylase 1
LNVLVIAPHPDDETIGCGGAICLHVARGDRVVTVFLTSGELGLKDLPEDRAQVVREAEADAAAAVLGTASHSFLRLPDWCVGDDVGRVAAALSPVLNRERPERVYLPHPHDGHPDHRACLPILELCCSRPGATRPALRCYEVWSPMAEFDEVEDISAVMDRKLRALACYRSQMAQYRYDRAAAGLNQYRGALAGRCDHAEVFRTPDLDTPRS